MKSSTPCSARVPQLETRVGKFGEQRARSRIEDVAVGYDERRGFEHVVIEVELRPIAPTRKKASFVYATSRVHT